MFRFIRYRVSKILAVIIGVEALIVMAGWVLRIDALTRIAPTGINMKFVTALLFFFSAFGVYCISRVVEEKDEWSAIFLPAISLIIFLITISLLAGRILGISTGIENLFLQSSSSVTDFSGTISTEGWPSFPTLINFILFGLVGIISIFTSSLREKFIVYSGWFIFSVGLIALVGYTFNLPLLYYQLSFSTVPMALNTAVLFLLLGFGLTQMFQSKEHNEA